MSAKRRPKILRFGGKKKLNLKRCLVPEGPFMMGTPGDTFDELVGSTETEAFVWVTAHVWFDMIDDEIRGIEGTVAVASRNAYMRRSAGASVSDWPAMTIPCSETMA